MFSKRKIERKKIKYYKNRKKMYSMLIRYLLHYKFALCRRSSNRWSHFSHSWDFTLSRRQTDLRSTCLTLSTWLWTSLNPPWCLRRCFRPFDLSSRCPIVWLLMCSRECCFANLGVVAFANLGVVAFANDKIFRDSWSVISISWTVQFKVFLFGLDLMLTEVCFRLQMPMWQTHLSSLLAMLTSLVVENR